MERVKIARQVDDQGVRLGRMDPVMALEMGLAMVPVGQVDVAPEALGRVVQVEAMVSRWAKAGAEKDRVKAAEDRKACVRIPASFHRTGQATLKILMPTLGWMATSHRRLEMFQGAVPVVVAVFKARAAKLEALAAADEGVALAVAVVPVAVQVVAQGKGDVRRCKTRDSPKVEPISRVPARGLVQALSIPMWAVH